MLSEKRTRVARSCRALQASPAQVRPVRAETGDPLGYEQSQCDDHKVTNLDVAPPRTAVLLGAGASFDAGLPLTNEFADKLIASLEADLHRFDPLVRAVYFVYGAMVGYHSRQGGSPREAVNVETMISALRLLRHRDVHEVAPFVNSWNDMSDRFSLPRYSEYGQRLEREVSRIVTDERPSGEGLENLIRRIAQDVISSPSDTSLFGELETAISVRVRRILSAHRSVDYLRPLIQAAVTQPGGIDIATLNYDLTVEHAAQMQGVGVDRGPDHARLGIPLDFADDAAIRLYKLHGSIDLRERYVDANDTRRFEIVRDASDDDFAPRIVIGDRDKLGSGGSTLPLLVGFAQALEKTSRLAVVGYSFRDDHVNSMIYDWLDADVGRTLTVLDPSWPHPDDGWDPRLELTRKLNEARPARIAVVRVGTAEGLDRALSSLPATQPDPRLALTATLSAESARVAIQNLGSPLTDVRVTTNMLAEPTTMLIDHPDAAEESTRTWTLPALTTNETIELHLTFSRVTSARGITISGRDDVASIDETWDLTDPPMVRNRLR